MTVLVVWYLLVYRSSSMVTVPQVSQAQCLSTAKWINENHMDVWAPDAAICVPGK